MRELGKLLLNSHLVGVDSSTYFYWAARDASVGLATAAGGISRPWD